MKGMICAIPCFRKASRWWMLSTCDRSWFLLLKITHVIIHSKWLKHSIDRRHNYEIMIHWFTGLSWIFQRDLTWMTKLSVVWPKSTRLNGVMKMIKIRGVSRSASLVGKAGFWPPQTWWKWVGVGVGYLELFFFDWFVGWTSRQWLGQIQGKPETGFAGFSFGEPQA